MADPDPQGGVWAALGVALAWLSTRLWPLVRGLGPRLLAAVTGQRASAAATAKIEEETRSLRRAADLSLLEHYEVALERAEQREAQRDAREAAREAALRELAGLEAECRELHRQSQERAEQTEARAELTAAQLTHTAAELAQTKGQVRDLLRTVTALAVRVGGTPPAGHSTITAPLDPLADPRDSRADPASMTTPPAGHRLAAPSVPRDDPDPTPDLHASVTPRGS